MKEAFAYLRTPEGRKMSVLMVCTGGFIGALIISSITSSKLYAINIFSLNVIVPVGTSMFTITFMCTDALTEVFSKTHAMILVFLGFLERIGTFLFLTFAIHVQGAGAPIWDNQDAYASVLGGSSRVVLAGILTYPISQMTDILIFNYFKKKHQGKNMLWFRNTLSTLTSQLVDSAVFITIAFGGILSFSVILNVIMGQIIVKWLVAVCDTPFVYMIRNYAQGRKLLDFKG